MKDRSGDPWHHERTLLPRSYISLPGNSDAGHSFALTSVTAENMFVRLNKVLLCSKCITGPVVMGVVMLDNDLTNQCYQPKGDTLTVNILICRRLRPECK